MPTRRPPSFLGLKPGARQSSRAPSWHGRIAPRVGLLLQHRVESPQAVAFLAEYGTQIREGHGISAAWASMVYSLAPQQVAHPLVQPNAIATPGVRVASHELEAGV